MTDPLVTSARGVHAREADRARLPSCAICGAADGRQWPAREMMFGLRDPFLYIECAVCGCLRLADPPADFSRYYPESYYSLEAPPRRPGGIIGWLRRRRNAFAFTGDGVFGRLLQARAPYPIEGVADWLRRVGGGRDSRILDVGCGTGALVHDLALAGFRRPIGIDPFIADDLHYEVGASVLKREITQVEGPFDLIVFNHSLEHIADQLGTLRTVRALLAPGGMCVARTPTVSSFAWEHFRTDWVQLDAPRHLHIHSAESMRRAASAAGLELIDVSYDSCEFQFVGSELYRRDIPYVEGNGSFSRAEIRRYRRRARELNAEGRGDQASFFLRPA
jgi:SAM-dependent methyltransferase